MRRGLELTPGGYKALTQLFNIPAADCRRMLTFLRRTRLLCADPLHKGGQATQRLFAERA